MLRVVYAAGVVLLIVGLFSTFSRAAIFAFSFVAVGAIAREVRGARGTLVTAGILVIGMMVAPRYYWDRLLSLSEVGATVQYDWSIHIRLEALRAAWEYFTQHPLTGLGVNNFADRATYRLMSRVAVHNSYLEMLVGGGIPLLLMFFVVFLMLLAVFMLVLRHFRKFQLPSTTTVRCSVQYSIFRNDRNTGNREVGQAFTG